MDIGLTYFRKDSVSVDGRVPCSVWRLLGHVRLGTESGGEREVLVEGSHGVQRLILIAGPISNRGKAFQRLFQTEMGYESWEIQLPVRAQTDAESKAPF